MYSHVSQLAENAVTTDEAVRLARTSSTSNYSWEKLSPNSQQIRRSNLVKERQKFAKQASKLLDLTGSPYITWFVQPWLCNFYCRYAP